MEQRQDKQRNHKNARQRAEALHLTCLDAHTACGELCTTVMGDGKVVGIAEDGFVVEVAAEAGKGGGLKAWTAAAPCV